jgi:hypothetical protein
VQHGGRNEKSASGLSSIPTFEHVGFIGHWQRLTQCQGREKIQEPEMKRLLGQMPHQVGGSARSLWLLWSSGHGSQERREA